MTTLTLWLLIVTGNRNDVPAVLERFPTLQECERVKSAINPREGWGRCVQATVVR